MRKLILAGMLFLGVISLCGFAPLKVMTLNFNSEAVPSDWGGRLRDLRYRAMVDWIKTNQPDIVLLQEGWNYRGRPSVAITLAKALGYDAAYRLGMGVTGFLVDSDAILAKKNLQMRAERDIKLPHSAPEIGDGKSWVVCFGSVSWAVGVTVTGHDGQPVFVYSTHFIGANLNDRRDQAAAVVSDMQKRAAQYKVNWQNANVIVGGDMNSQPWDPAPRFLTGAGFFDSFATVHPNDSSCSVCADYSQPYFNPTTIGGDMLPSQNALSGDVRYDYIFSHGPELQPLDSTLVFSFPFDGVWMSDHYGVYSTFGVGRMAHNPDRDFAPLPLPQVVTVSDEDLYCEQYPCRVELPAVKPVWGASGVVVHNTADHVISVHLNGPGEIFTDEDATLKPGESAGFSFRSAGSYHFLIRAVTVDEGYDADVVGAVKVIKGY